MENKNTDLTIVKQQENAVGALATGMFKDIDFAGLNRIIDVIGDKSANLGAEEKMAATEIVSQWENNVLARLKANGNKMRGMTQMLNKNSQSHLWLNPTVGSNYMSQEQIDQIVFATDTKALFKEAQLAYEMQHEFRKENAPESPYTDDNMSYNEIARLTKRYEAEQSRYNIECTRYARKTHLAFQAFIKVLVKHKSVKEMLKKAEAYTASLEGYTTECQNKATMAKLNIQISSSEIRNMIHEMLDFASSI